MLNEVNLEKKGKKEKKFNRSENGGGGIKK
jgi:hypothetical protein